MADTPVKKRKLRKASATVRQQAEKAANSSPKQRRIKSTARTVARPIRAAHRIGKKEYYLPLPDNKVGRFLNKKRRFFPRYFADAWRELRLVTWPNRRETLKLTLAVFMFAFTFGLLIAMVDAGLDFLFRRFILG